MHYLHCIVDKIFVQIGPHLGEHFIQKSQKIGSKGLLRAPLTVSKIRITIAVLMKFTWSLLYEFCHLGWNSGCNWQVARDRPLIFVKMCHKNTFFALFLTFFTLHWNSWQMSFGLKKFDYNLSSFRLSLGYLGLFELIWADLESLRLIWAYLGSYSAHLSLFRFIKVCLRLFRFI